jgi:DNA ligase-1
MYKVELYKLNKKNGKIQYWAIFSEDNYFYTLDGYLGGKITESDKTYCIAKNIGKANQTTAQEQAVKQAEAKTKKKLEKGYIEDVNKVEEAALSFEPMLAQKFSKFDGTCISQPKLDGIRCITKKDSIKTRTGKDHLSVPHIVDALSEVFDEFPNVVIDGELYNHDLKNFNKISSIVRKSKPTQKDLEESSNNIQYHIYDCYFEDKPELTFTERTELLMSYISNNVLSQSIKLVESVIIESKEQLDVLYGDYLKSGYEGQMVRSDEPYEQKRSKTLQKRKEFIDEEFEIVNIEEGVGNWAGKAKTITFKKEDGTTFSTGVKGNMEYCTELLENKEKNIGKMATVRFQEYTPDNTPRFGVLYSVRNYE